MGKKFYISLCLMSLLIAIAVTRELFFEGTDPLIFLAFYSIPSNMAISVFPHEPLVVYYGSLYAPWLISSIMMIGTIIAGLLDYYVFAPILQHRLSDYFRNTAEFKRTSKWFKKQPFLALVVGGFTPLPFFLFKILAFANHYPVSKYLAALFIGRFPRYYLLAYAGKIFGIPPEIILIIFIVMFLFYTSNMWMRYRKEKREKYDSPDSIEANKLDDESSDPSAENVE